MSQTARISFMCNSCENICSTNSASTLKTEAGPRKQWQRSIRSMFFFPNENVESVHVVHLQRSM